MKDTNNGMLICRLTKDAELTFMQSGSAKLEFSVAFTTSRNNGNEWVDETNYLNNLTLWGKRAESLDKFLKKGTLIALSYHLKVDTWEKDGERKSQLKTVVDDVQLLSKSNNSTSSGTEKPQKNISGEDFPEDIPYSNGSNEDIPF